MKWGHTDWQRIFESIKEGAQRLFERAFYFVQNRFFEYRRGLAPASLADLGREINGLIIATDETYEWAVHLEEQLEIELQSLYPDCALDLKMIFVKGDDAAVHNALMFHPALMGANKERFSFVVTPGYAVSKMVYDIRKAFDLSIAQVYCVENALTSPDIQTNSGTAGVHNTPMSGREYADVVRGLMPNVAAACLVFTPNYTAGFEQTMLERHRRIITQALAAAGIKVIEHYWDYQDSYEGDLLAKMRACDVVITLDEAAAYRHCKSLVSLCEMEKKVLCASELDSVFAGAAFGGGITKAAYGKVVVGLIHGLLLGDEIVGAHQIPAQSGMRYNLPAMRRQGLVLSAETAALMRLKSIYDQDTISIEE